MKLISSSTKAGRGREKAVTTEEFSCGISGIIFWKTLGFATLSTSGVLTNHLNQVFIYDGNLETFFTFFQAHSFLTPIILNNVVTTNINRVPL